MAHSNQVREFLLTHQGIKLHNVYVGPTGVLTGAARAQQEYKDKNTRLAREQRTERRKREVARKRRQIEAQIELLQAELAADETEANQTNTEAIAREERSTADRVELTRNRSTENKKKGSLRHGQ